VTAEWREKPGSDTLARLHGPPSAPAWRLLGSMTRERIKVYTHLGFGHMVSAYESLEKNAIATPNFVIQEEMSGVVPWYHAMVDGPIRLHDGHWQMPDRPGLGVEVDEQVAAKHPFDQGVLHATHALLADGTAVDW
jgi:L-alanine-DL-glutamate epimerase-like enolase superfamily enzyme